MKSRTIHIYRAIASRRTNRTADTQARYYSKCRCFQFPAASSVNSNQCTELGMPGSSPGTPPGTQPGSGTGQCSRHHYPLLCGAQIAKTWKQLTRQQNGRLEFSLWRACEIMRLWKSAFKYRTHMDIIYNIVCLKPKGKYRSVKSLPVLRSYRDLSTSQILC